MGTRRNGSSTWVTMLLIACRVSHLPGFKQGLVAMMGQENADTVYALWTPICDWLEEYRATDDKPFQKDYTGGEPQDITPP